VWWWGPQRAIRNHGPCEGQYLLAHAEVIIIKRGLIGAVGIGHGTSHIMDGVRTVDCSSFGGCLPLEL